MRKRIVAFLIVVLAAALPAAALGASPKNINLTLPGLGTEIGLSFEEVSGLNLLSLGISARVVNPWDPAFRARFPEGTAPSVLPVMLRIEPPAWSGLTFRGVVSFEIHTELLPYVPDTRLRIFKAPLGGPFQDVTVAMGPGSYRARGDTGGFSEFIIAVDRRPVKEVIEAKLDALDAMLAAPGGFSVQGSVYNELRDCLEAIRNPIGTESTQDGAIGQVDRFLEIVEEHSGTDIPNVWRASRDVENVAGNLRAAALSLRFSLALRDASGE